MDIVTIVFGKKHHQMTYFVEQTDHQEGLQKNYVSKIVALLASAQTVIFRNLDAMAKMGGWARKLQKFIY